MFSYAVAVMDTIEGWQEENWVGSRFVACMLIYTKALICNGQENMQEYRLFQFRSIMEADHETGVLTETGCEAKERIKKFQSHCADIGDVEVVRIVYRSSSGEEKEQSWTQLHVGGIDGISCQHLQVMLLRK